jgi:hypothetical protein
VLAVPLIVLLALAVAWLAREQIAGNVIADELERRGIQATYEVEQIGPQRQILRNIAIGDPARPDLTIDRAIVEVIPRLGIPTLGEIRLIRPRLYGTWIDGQLSFGALDPLLFTERREPRELPDLDLAIEDGRALLESDYGPLGLKVTGRGNVRESFVGELGAVAPRLALQGCEARSATLYGRIATSAGRAGFTGPLRLTSLRCAERGISIRQAVVHLKAQSDEQLARFEGDAQIRLGASAIPQGILASTQGDARFTWRDGGLTARFDLAGRGLVSNEAALTSVRAEGSLRARDHFARFELDAQLNGEGLRLGNGLDGTLADAARSTEGTLLRPLLERVRRLLMVKGRGSRLAADLYLRQAGERTALVVPNASLHGASGETLLAVSRLQFALGAGGVSGAAGNFATGGEGMPRVVGRVEQQAGGAVQWRLAMARYEAGGSVLAVPELVLLQRPGQGLTFAGEVLVSGLLPGGRADALRLPISGSWSSAGELALWGRCTAMRFDRLQYANVTLDRRSLAVCPSRGEPIVRYGRGGLRIAAGAPSLQVAGRLGETPIALSSGAVGFAYPGTLSARAIEVMLGPAANAQRFVINDLTARIGEDVAGRFAGTDAHLFSVPLDLLGASGDWRYADGRLTLSDGSFRLQDRQEPDRFEPLVARGATLTLADNVITAEALLREPGTDRRVTTATLRHDLATGRGSADLAIAGLTFDRGFQPTQLTQRARGVVALVRGTVSGTGRIDWGPQGVTSTGRFSSDSLDFAAAFGPVRGASGTIEFTDLLGLTTAPNQRLRVASVNPGIEVTDGEILVQVRGGQVLALQGGTWPFMGGTLTMRPVDITFGASEVRRYVLEIVGLDAARFVERMELQNISATGVFDGTVPIVFDRTGNGRVEGGVLLSRPPGGNVSYVGALTYEDLSAIANYAFAALRSLDYRQMRVAMDGDLTGEIVTRVRFDGVSQGAGTTRNFVTRAVAGLPIRFDVNVRAPFYSLLSSIKAMYDPSAIRDPRELGLLDAQGNVLRRETDSPPPPPVQPDDLIPDGAVIQRRESEEMP